MLQKDGHNLVRVIGYHNSVYDLINSYDIEIEDSIKNIGIYATPQYDSNIIMFSQNSLKSPPSLYEMNLDTREFTLKGKSLYLIIMKICMIQKDSMLLVMTVLRFLFL